MRCPIARRAARTFAIIAGFLILSTTGGAAQIYQIYDWETPSQGWFEPTLWNSYVADGDGPYVHFDRILDRDELWAHTLEVEYGVTDRWVVAGYLDFEDPDGESLRYIRSRITTRYRLFDRYERFFDTALYAEYLFTDPDYDDADELEARVIMEKDLEDFRLLLNPIFSKDVSGDDVTNQAKFSFAGGLHYRRYYAVQPGVEVFANVGEVTRDAVLLDRDSGLDLIELDETGQDVVSPVVAIRFARGWIWTLGAAFGVSDPSDDLTFRSILSYEFETVRPSRQGR